MLDTSLHEESVADIVSAGLDGADEDVLVVNPTKATIRAIVDQLGDVSEAPTLRMMADEGPLKELTDDFLVASAIADMIDAGRLELRILEAVPRTSLLVSPSSVVSLVNGGGQIAGLTTTEDGFVTSTVEYYEALWEDAPAFTLRTPPLSNVRNTLAEDIGEETAEDFDAVLDALDEAIGNGNGLDEVTISLLVAGRNGVLLYDISKWGEDIGLASKATFSRTKTRLEDKNLIDTEKVPIDVGRPRLRLRLDESELDDTDIETMVAQATTALKEA